MSLQSVDLAAAGTWSVLSLQSVDFAAAKLPPVLAVANVVSTECVFVAATLCLKLHMCTL